MARTNPACRRPSQKWIRSLPSAAKLILGSCSSRKKHAHNQQEGQRGTRILQPSSFQRPAAQCDVSIQSAHDALEEDEDVHKHLDNKVCQPFLVVCLSLFDALMHSYFAFLIAYI
jgi:hypothetical protein